MKIRSIVQSIINPKSSDLDITKIDPVEELKVIKAKFKQLNKKKETLHGSDYLLSMRDNINMYITIIYHFFYIKGCKSYDNEYHLYLDDTDLSNSLIWYKYVREFINCLCHREKKRDIVGSYTENDITEIDNLIKIIYDVSKTYGIDDNPYHKFELSFKKKKEIAHFVLFTKELFGKTQPTEIANESFYLEETIQTISKRLEIRKFIN